jgi:hypothetical protein
MELTGVNISVWPEEKGGGERETRRYERKLR